jgi:hypothetical protein
MTIKFVLNMSTLKIVYHIMLSEANVKELSHCMMCGAH